MTAEEKENRISAENENPVSEENENQVSEENENPVSEENDMPLTGENSGIPVLPDADTAEAANEPPAEEAPADPEAAPGAAEAPEEAHAGTSPEAPAEDALCAAPEPEDSRAEDVLAAVRAENERLRTELETARAAADRLADGYAELGELFPGADLRAMPDSFREAVKNGVPPAAAYALEIRRREVERSRAEEASRRARGASAGGLSGSAPSLYSPDEVRAMSPAEVRENYSLILDSMRRW